MRKCGRATPITGGMWRARIRGSAARLCLIAGALASLVLCSAQAAGAETELPKLGPTGATGPTGPAGERGSTGERGPTGPAGTGGGGGEASSFGKYTGAGSTGGLASGKQESGVWTVMIHAPAATEQVEADGVASFPIPLKNKEKVKLNYRNETEALTSTAPCLGTTQEPVVEKGNFCAYRGGNGVGSKEKGTGVGNVDKNVTSTPFFQAANGDRITETGEAGDGDIGVLIVFRTSEFSEAEPVTSLLAESNLHAVGSWAVAAK